MRITKDMAVKAFRLATLVMLKGYIHSQKYKLAKEVRDYFKEKLEGKQNETIKRNGFRGDRA